MAKKKKKKPPAKNSPDASEDTAAKRPLTAKTASFVVLVAILVVLGVLFYRVMSRFLLPLFFAALLVVIFRPVHVWVISHVGKRERLAAGLTTALILVVVLLPLTWIGAQAVIDGVEIFTRTTGRPGAVQTDVEPGVLPAQLSAKLGRFRKTFGLDLLHIEQLQAVEEEIEDLSQAAGTIDQSTDLAQATSSILAKIDRLSAAVSTEPVLPAQEGNEADRQARQRAHEEALAEWRQLEPDLNKIVARMRQSIEEARDMLHSREHRASSASLSGEAGVEASPSVKDPPTDTRADAISPSVPPLGLTAHRVLPRELADFQIELERAQILAKSFRRRVSGGAVQAFLASVFNPSDRQLRQYRKNALGVLQPYLLSLTRRTTGFAGSLLFWLAIMTLALYYFLLDGPEMVHTVMRLSPLDDRYEQQLLDEFDSISRAVVLATLLSAVAQGLLAGIGFWFAGVDALFLFTALTMVFALIPFVGAAAIWVPVCLWIWIVDERTLAAALLAIYCAVVVSMVDNLIKPWILHGRSNMHPLLALLSVLGGVSALGPAGILVGPMVVAFFHAALNMLRREISGEAENAAAELA